MILTDYYRFDRLASKAKSRMDCTFSTRSYPEFEERAITRALKATEKRDATERQGTLLFITTMYRHNLQVSHIGKPTKAYL